MARSLEQQTADLAGVFGDIIRAYQFRDRNAICCHGISVTQCYLLEALQVRGALTMGEIAEQLYLDTSTVTRIVDQLIRRNLVSREVDVDDRRVVRARMTRKGQGLVTKIRKELLDDYRAVLEGLPASSREDAIEVLRGLFTVFHERACCRTDRPTPAKARRALAGSRSC